MPRRCCDALSRTQELDCGSLSWWSSRGLPSTLPVVDWHMFQWSPPSLSLSLSLSFSLSLSLSFYPSSAGPKSHAISHAWDGAWDVSCDAGSEGLERCRDGERPS
eukprot:2797658-Pyramimonas_sp.AAC.2